MKSVAPAVVIWLLLVSCTHTHIRVNNRKSVNNKWGKVETGFFLNAEREKNACKTRKGKKKFVACGGAAAAAFL